MKKLSARTPIYEITLCRTVQTSSLCYGKYSIECNVYNPLSNKIIDTINIIVNENDNIFNSLVDVINYSLMQGLYHEKNNRTLEVVNEKRTQVEKAWKTFTICLFDHLKVCGEPISIHSSIN